MVLIVVKGRPVSINSSSRNIVRWKSQVAAEAKAVCAVPLTYEDLEMKITFFYKAVPDFDTDNVSKPTIDALTGIAFYDDKQVRKHNVAMVDLKGSFKIGEPNLT